MVRAPVWAAASVALVLGIAPACAAAEPKRGQDADRAAALGESLVIGTVPQRTHGQRILDSQDGQRIAAAGISSVRLWLDWSEIESEPGLYDWSEPDDAIREVASVGLTTLPYLFATPGWAARVDRQDCRPNDCGGYPPASVPTRLAFARFAGAAVERYGPDGEFWDRHRGLPYRPITVWQIWNEPNLKSYFLPEVDPVAYARLVQQAAEEIHEEDATAEVVIGGLSGSRTTPTRMATAEFLTQFYAVPAITQSFEGLALHPYARNPTGVFEQLESASAVTALHDPGVPLWITELGWASDGSRVWGPVKTRKGQARMVRRVFGRLLREATWWNLRGAYWYAWRDTEPAKAVCGWCWAAGLLDVAGNPKPAYHALMRLTGGR